MPRHPDARSSEEKLYTIREAAEYLRISVSWLYKLAQREQVPVGRVGRQYRFRKQDLDEYLGHPTEGRQAGAGKRSIESPEVVRPAGPVRDNDAADSALMSLLREVFGAEHSSSILGELDAQARATGKQIPNARTSIDTSFRVDAALNEAFRVRCGLSEVNENQEAQSFLEAVSEPAGELFDHALSLPESDSLREITRLLNLLAALAVKTNMTLDRAKGAMLLAEPHIYFKPQENTDPSDHRARQAAALDLAILVLYQTPPDLQMLVTDDATNNEKDGGRREPPTLKEWLFWRFIVLLDRDRFDDGSPIPWDQRLLLARSFCYSYSGLTESLQEDLVKLWEKEERAKFRTNKIISDLISLHREYHSG